ncbi:MAG: hypothetical protein Q8J64_08865 [Thermodesulfovibrionales bacterium]|nr:hypothetical protein [Thermodesulfovibrionales bacterium]
MSMNEELLGKVIEYARANCEKEIDDAYDYFWEEEYPEDYLQGIALDVAFINFEDWLICDRQIRDGETIIDLYIRENTGLSGKELAVLREMKESVISLYEVKAASPEPFLSDLLLGAEFPVKKGLPPEGLNKGDVFASRFFKIDGDYVMGKCIYPYGKGMKAKALGQIKKQFDRFMKNEKGLATGKDLPAGLMREFLKKYSDTFNVIWFSNLYKGR